MTYNKRSNKYVILAAAALVLYLMMIFVLAFYTIELGPRTIPIIMFLESVGIVLTLSVVPAILGYVIGANNR